MSKSISDVRRHGLDQVFEGIFVHAAPKVEQQGGLLRVGQKQRIIVSLLEVFADRLVIGEIAVVHERFMKRAERMAAAGMPHPAARGVPLVGKPDVGLEIVEFIIPDDILRITDDLQDHHVPAVGHDKGTLFAERRVIVGVDLETVLINKLVLRVAAVEGCEIIIRYILVEDVILDADEVAHDVRGPDLEAEAAVVIDRGQLLGFIDCEMAFDESVLDLGGRARVEKRDVDHVVVVQDLPGNPERPGEESHGADSAALPVAAVVHLHGGLEDVLPRDGDRTDESGDAAAAFRLGFWSERRKPAAKRGAGV